MSGSDIFDRVFTRVCHVKHGYEDREQHIVREFSRRGVPCHFFLDWDVPDLPPDALASRLRPAVVSLALKHQGIWRDFLASGKPYCLIFEDDVFLAKDFMTKLARCIDELGSPSRRAVVYLGNAGSYYIPLLKLERGRHLYPARHGRCTDSYLITRPVAEARCEWFRKNKLALPIDHQVDAIDRELGIEILWFERPIVEQGTHTGAFASSIPGPTRPNWQKRIVWNWKKATHQIKGRMR